MPLYTSEAIVLRKVDYQEADRILTFLTLERGRLSGLAKGAKRIRSRFGASLEVLTYGKLIYFDRQGKNLVSVNQFDIIHSYQKVRENLVQSSSCQYLAELIMAFLPEKEPAPDLFHLFLASLKQIEGSRDTEAILRIFEIRFLALIGFAPRMDACVSCENTAETYGFSRKLGGIVCPSCRGRSADVAEISPGSLFFWRQVLSMQIDKMDRIRLQVSLNAELKDLIHRYLLHQLGREIRSYIFLERIRNEASVSKPRSG